jgi:hypothetical protein
MTTHLHQPMNDTCRSDDVSGAIAVLRRQLTGQAPRPAADEVRHPWVACWMIRPSTHQRVAIDLHRQDRLGV